MMAYIELVMVLGFLVNWLLLMGANRLCGNSPRPGRAALGAGLGGLYAGACLLPGFAFLTNLLWRTVMLILMAIAAYGLQKATIRRGVLFLLLSMALSGIVLGVGDRKPWSLLAAAVGVCLLCGVGLRGNLGGPGYTPVELCYRGRSVKLTALQDTGNTLVDPVTGCPVLVVDGVSAQKLTGLSQTQLRQPVQTMGAIPGLRLIPYRAVGTPNGLLLALNLQQVKIGSWQGSRVVAFAPEQLSADGEYQALIGGVA